jgi:hypothetical protein
MCYLLLSQGRAVGGQTASQVLWQAAWPELHLGHFAIDSGKVARFATQSSPRALAVDTAGTRVRLLGSPQLIAASSRMDAGRALRARSRRREDRIDDVTVPRVGSGLRRPEGPIWTERTIVRGAVRRHALRVCRRRWPNWGELLSAGHFLTYQGRGENYAEARARSSAVD